MATGSEVASSVEAEPSLQLWAESNLQGLAEPIHEHAFGIGACFGYALQNVCTVCCNICIRIHFRAVSRNVSSNSDHKGV